MSLVKGKNYSKADYGIKFPRNLITTTTINNEDYVFFTIKCDYNNELSPNGIIIEPHSIDEVVYKDTAPKRTAHIFIRNKPKGKFEYSGDIDVIKPYDAKRNLVVVI